MLRIGDAGSGLPSFIGLVGADPYVLINPGVQKTYHFNEEGVLVLNKLELSLAHEIAHAAGLTDYFAPPEEENMNSSNYDFQGDVVRAVNTISINLGLSDYKRSSYQAALSESDPRLADLTSDTATHLESAWMLRG